MEKCTNVHNDRKILNKISIKYYIIFCIAHMRQASSQGEEGKGKT